MKEIVQMICRFCLGQPLVFATIEVSVLDGKIIMHFFSIPNLLLLNSSICFYDLLITRNV